MSGLTNLNPCNIHTVIGLDAHVAREQELCANPATVSYRLGFDRYVDLCLDHSKQLAHDPYDKMN